MTEKPSQPKYPWAQLYDSESGVVDIPRTASGPGRPKNLVTRHKTSLSFLDEEKRVFEKVTYEITQLLHPHKVTKSQVLGLAIRLLENEMGSLPKYIHSWEQLAHELFAKLDESQE